MPNQLSIDLSYHSTFSLNAKCSKLIEVDSIESLVEFASHLDSNEDFLILGEGSNTVFVESYEGTILQPKFKGIAINEKNDCFEIKIGAGENWHSLVLDLVNKGIYGLENLALIPGSVGAAPVQNIGAYGVEFGEYCKNIDWFDFEEKKITTLPAEQCQFGYRDSIFKQGKLGLGVICSVTMELPKQWVANLSYRGLDTLPNDATAKDIFERVVEIRQSKLPDPKTIPNVGSFFKNPIVPVTQFERLNINYPNMPFFNVDDDHVKLAAGWLIETAGFKGKSIGGIKVHEKQALVLTNYNNGTGKELIALVMQIQDSIEQTFNIVLEPEVRLIGSKGLKNLREFNL